MHVDRSQVVGMITVIVVALLATVGCDLVTGRRTLSLPPLVEPAEPQDRLTVGGG